MKHEVGTDLVAFNTATAEAFEEGAVTHDGMAGHVTSAAVVFRAGGYEYDEITVKGCKVCNDLADRNLRRPVDVMLYRGYGLTTIARWAVSRWRRDLDENSDEFKSVVANLVRSLGRHKDKHLDVRQRVRRVVVENRVQELGLVADEMEGTLVDHISFARSVVQGAFDGMDERNPTISEGIRAARLLAAIEASTEMGVDRAVLLSVVRRILDWAEGLIPPEVFNAEVRKLAADPIIQAADERFREKSTVAVGGG